MTNTQGGDRRCGPNTEPTRTLKAPTTRFALVDTWLLDPAPYLDPRPESLDELRLRLLTWLDDLPRDHRAALADLRATIVDL